MHLDKKIRSRVRVSWRFQYHHERSIVCGLLLAALRCAALRYTHARPQPRYTRLSVPLPLPLPLRVKPQGGPTGGVRSRRVRLR